MPVPESKGLIIYFHGNGGNFSHRLPKVKELLSAGYEVLLAEYRGYGGNPGTPDEEGFYADGRAFMNTAFARKPKKIFIYGESIGSGTATQMATEYKIDGLVLEAPFSSLVEVAQQRYVIVPVSLLLKDRYMNSKKIQNIKAPLLILHGHKDNVIPFPFAKSLYDKAKEPKKFIEYPKGEHNNLQQLGAMQDVVEFLDNLE